MEYPSVVESTSEPATPASVIETESAVVVDKPQEYQFTDCDLYTFYASAMLALVLLPLSILSTVCSYGDYNAEVGYTSNQHELWVWSGLTWSLFFSFFYLAMIHGVEAFFPSCKGWVWGQPGYSWGSGVQCILHCGVMLPLIIIAAIIYRGADQELDHWLQSKWGDDDNTFERLVFYCCLGHCFKDFLAAHKTAMDGVFTFHHFAVMLGTWASLSVPLMGWVTLNAVNAELGSFFYNIYDQYGRQSEEQPDRIGIWRLVYWITMTISNTIAAVVAIIVLLDDSTDDSYKGIYVGVVGGLEILRNAGVAIDLCDAFGNSEGNHTEVEATTFTTPPAKGSDSVLPV